LAGDLNVKHPFVNRAVSNPSGGNLLDLFGVNEFEISAARCHTHYSPAGNGDVLDSMVHQNIRLSSVIVSDILDSDHLPLEVCRFTLHEIYEQNRPDKEKNTDRHLDGKG
jgi:hypothetical protein